MFCVSVKVKLFVLLLCVCVHAAWKGRPQNDLYCVGWDVKPYSLTYVYFLWVFCQIEWKMITMYWLQGASEKDIVHSGLAQTMEGIALVIQHSLKCYCFVVLFFFVVGKSRLLYIQINPMKNKPISFCHNCVMVWPIWLNSFIDILCNKFAAVKWAIKDLVTPQMCQCTTMWNSVSSGISGLTNLQLFVYYFIIGCIYDMFRMSWLVYFNCATNVANEIALYFVKCEYMKVKSLHFMDHSVYF